MAMVINSNIASMNVQRNLSSSQSSMNEAMQRLSSGLRINSAKDDAAGLAIATRFTTQINGLNQAIRNANDGISLSQTGEAALSEVTNNLQRIRELAIQSANATNASGDREAIDAEVQQRISEITRIANQTSFNGQKILNGSLGTTTFQVGANVGETIDVALAQGVRATQIGAIASDSGVVTATALVAGDLTIQVGSGTSTSIGATTATAAEAAVGLTASSAAVKAEAINDAGIEGLTASATNTVELNFTAFGSTAEASDVFTFGLNGVSNILDYSGTDINSVTIDDVMAKINAYSSETGVTATQAGASALTLTASDGRDIIMDQAIQDANDGVTGTLAGGLHATLNGGANLTVRTSGAADIGVTDLDNTGTVTLTATDNITLGGVAESKLGFGDGEVLRATSNLSDSSVTSVSESELTVHRVDAALAAVSDLRSSFGAIQNRFESTISNLSTINENLTASRSRIEDADFAVETAKLSRAQILQQAGTSILAQANVSTQSVLNLLQ